MVFGSSVVDEAASVVSDSVSDLEVSWVDVAFAVVFGVEVVLGVVAAAVVVVFAWGVVAVFAWAVVVVFAWALVVAVVFGVVGVVVLTWVEEESLSSKV